MILVAEMKTKWLGYVLFDLFTFWGQSVNQALFPSPYLSPPPLSLPPSPTASHLAHPAPLVFPSLAKEPTHTVRDCPLRSHYFTVEIIVLWLNMMKLVCYFEKLNE